MRDSIQGSGAISLRTRHMIVYVSLTPFRYRQNITNLSARFFFFNSTRKLSHHLYNAIMGLARSASPTLTQRKWSDKEMDRFQFLILYNIVDCSSYRFLIQDTPYA